MSEDKSLSIYLDTMQSQIIPLPDDLTEKEGYREIGRIWHKDAGEDGQRIVALLRPTYDEPLQWSAPLAITARSVASVYGKGQLSNTEIDEFAVALLHKTIQQIIKSNPELAPKTLEVPAPEIASPAPTPAIAATLAKATSLPALDTEIGGDPRQIPIPFSVIEDPHAKHLLTIWSVAGEPACIEGCDDSCVLDHEPGTYLGTNTSEVDDKALGNMLGMICGLHAQLKSDDPTNRLLASSTVQMAFHGHLTKGMSKQ